MEPSANAFALIKKWEQFRPTAYHGQDDPPNVWTVGWGHTRNVGPGDTRTVEQAEADLAADAAGAVTAINDLVKVELTQNQFDALTSLVFNIGRGNFIISAVLHYLNDQNFDMAAVAFTHFSRAGRDRFALLPRRKDEQALFLKA